MGEQLLRRDDARPGRAQAGIDFQNERELYTRAVRVLRSAVQIFVKHSEKYEHG